MWRARATFICLVAFPRYYCLVQDHFKTELCLFKFFILFCESRKKTCDTFDFMSSCQAESKNPPDWKCANYTSVQYTKQNDFVEIFEPCGTWASSGTRTSLLLTAKANHLHAQRKRLNYFFLSPFFCICRRQMYHTLKWGQKLHEVANLFLNS